MTENLVLVRNFLYKWFVIGFVILLISSVLYIFVKDFGAEVAQNLYGVEPAFYFNTMLVFLAVIKTILFIFILSPALALHWLSCCYKKKQ